MDDVRVFAVKYLYLVFRYPTDGRFLPWTFRLNGQTINVKLNPVSVSDDIDIIAKIAEKGGGIARLASFIAQPLIDNGQLLPLFCSERSDERYAEPSPMNIYACVNEHSALTSKVRAFIEFLEVAVRDRMD